jgi:hypothetical protein
MFFLLTQWKRAYKKPPKIPVGHIRRPNIIQQAQKKGSKKRCAEIWPHNVTKLARHSIYCLRRPALPSLDRLQTTRNLKGKQAHTMNKYDKYFLPHILYIQDHFCKYYVQRPDWCPHEILDVACIILDQPEDGQELIRQCLEYDSYPTMRGLRVFLSDDCSECYQVHRMDDLQVIHAVALQLTMRALKIVIEPKDDWAVEIDAYSGQPHLPISVQAAPDPEIIFEEIKQELDALVAEQQTKYDQYEAALATMTQSQKAAQYGKKAGSGLYEGTVGGIVDLVKAFPGFYVGYLKTLWRIGNLPRDVSRMLLDALISGDTSPIEDQIDQIVKPVAQTFEQADQLKGMMMVLFSDERTMAMLGDFAQSYWEATHPLERTEMGATAASDIVVAVLLAIVTAGVGAAAGVAAKAPRLAKLARLLEKLAGILKSTGAIHQLPKKEAPGSVVATARGISKPSSRNARSGGMPEVQTPESKPAPGAPDRPRDPVDKTKEMDYGESDKIEGPRTTTKKYKNTPPTQKDIDLAKKSGKSAEQIAARKRVASHFYENHGFDPDTIPAHLEGVDLNKPVEIVKLKEGTKLKQLQIPGAPQGNYYTNIDTPADKLGISLEVKHKETGEIIERIEGGYIVKRDTDALSSTTADILDNWSIPGRNFITKGGGNQYFSTDKVSIRSID